VTTGSASRIDEQILAIWRALRVNPSLDAHWAMQVIDRLLDERPRPGQDLPPVTPRGPQAVTPLAVAPPVRRRLAPVRQPPGRPGVEIDRHPRRPLADRRLR
jgi:hypothetical protein